MSCKNCFHFKACQGWVNAIALEEYYRGHGCDDFADKTQTVKLPCKVGDTVFAIDYKLEIIPFVVSHISVNSDSFYIYCKGKYRKTYLFEFKDSEIRKTVFSTRAEAEKALAEKERD